VETEQTLANLARTFLVGAVNVDAAGLGRGYPGLDLTQLEGGRFGHLLLLNRLIAPEWI
jgi:hypothetical protein